MVSEILGVIARNRGLPGTGGSDAHIPEDVGSAYTVFGAPVTSVHDLARAIQRGAIHPGNAAAALAKIAATYISAH